MSDHARPPEGVETWTAYVCSNCGAEEVAHSIHGMGCASGLNHVFEATEAVKRSALLAEREARERAEAERDEARKMLGLCYCYSGRDTGGDDWQFLWRDAVDAVRELRRDYEEALGE